MTPDVSVLIASYQASATIEAAIASALKQRGVSVEVIVCDDASTDFTEALLSADTRVTYTRHPQNRGQAGALNTAGNLATGRYFIQLDADDTLAPNSLKALVDVLDSDPNIGFTYGAAWVKGLQNYIHVPQSPYAKEQFYQRNASFYCVMYRREAWEAGLRYSDLADDMRGFLQDWNFILQLIENCGYTGFVLPLHLVLEYNFKPNTLYHRMKEREQEVLAAFKQRWPMVIAEAI